MMIKAKSQTAFEAGSDSKSFQLINLHRVQPPPTVDTATENQQTRDINIMIMDSEKQDAIV